MYNHITYYFDNPSDYQKAHEFVIFPAWVGSFHDANDNPTEEIIKAMGWWFRNVHPKQYRRAHNMFLDLLAIRRRHRLMSKMDRAKELANLSRVKFFNPISLTGE